MTPTSILARRHREAGFTLLEVVVAFAIFAVSFAALLQIFSGGLSNAAVADRALIALGHAESLLARAGVEQPLAEGTRSGALPGGMSWQESIARYSDTQTLASPPPVALPSGKKRMAPRLSRLISSAAVRMRTSASGGSSRPVASPSIP